MRGAGFQVQVEEHADLEPVRQRLGVPQGKASCHTAQVGGYFVEGHVPASAVKKMLAEKPSVRGLTIPGMPANAPGMGPHIVGTLKVYTLPKAGESSRLYSVE